MLVGHILEDDDVFRRSEARLPQERVLVTLERALLHRMLQKGSDALEPRGSQQHVGVFCLPYKQSVTTVVVSNGEHVKPSLSQFVRCSSISVAKTCARDMIKPAYLIPQVVTSDSLSKLSLCISTTATFNFALSPQAASPPVQLANTLQQRSPATPPGGLRQSSASQFHGFALQLFDAWFIDTSTCVW